MPKGLGKGLGALIPESNKGQQMAPQEEKQAGKESIYNIEISHIIPNKYQPRKEFNPEKLNDLVASIKEKGVIQPISVRKIGEGQYELIAGERRLRATKEAGLSIIPAIVKAVNDEDMLELALIENIQRDDLNSIEEAQAYRRLLEEFNLTHDDLSKKVGKDRSTITNILRLLNLPIKIQEYVSRETISMGHARVLLSLESANLQNTICESVIKKGLSVRQTESLVARLKKIQKGPNKPNADIDIHIAEAEKQMQYALGAKVKVRGRLKGRVEIHYANLDELNRIYDLIKDIGKPPQR